jgi:integrase
MSSVLLSDAIDAFGHDRRAKGIAPKTRANELAVLRLLLADVGNISVRRLKPQHADVFWAARAGWAPGTMNRARNTLNTFFSWCRDRGYMSRDVDPLAGTRAFKVPPRSRALIPQSEFDAVIGRRKNPRTRATIAIGIYTFARISEIQGLRWQDINSGAGTVEVFRQKTQTIDTLPICDELAVELARWKLEYAAHMGEQVRPEWFVIPGTTPPRGLATKGAKGFTAHRPRFYLPTKRSDLSKIIKQVLVDEGYYVPYEGGHTLRRSGATALYNQLTLVGHDRAIRICQAMLGHSSVQTTEVYLRLDLDRKVRDDLLAGKPMFPDQSEATVVPLRGSANGTQDSRVV